MAVYTIVLAKEEDGRFSVSVPALPGCHTWGDSYEHALTMAREAIDLYLEELKAHNEQVPTDESVSLATVEVA